MNETSDLDIFLIELQKEAEQQARLSRTRILPSQLDWLTSLIGTYPWQTTTVLSLVTAIGIQIAKII